MIRAGWNRWREMAGVIKKVPEVLKNNFYKTAIMGNVGRLENLTKPYGHNRNEDAEPDIRKTKKRSLIGPTPAK